ncbi:hypothetical protein PsYK624_099120 [Phanerochaete sordida]|uniref:Uncharacterized protein n=1 Tax=Phanerochaete sordida TaxID=48140 RepID=A0A9P3GFD1_9APHY|nr:hypothetical protein PsYK624_099120 [Phanerochaete sordida]
MSSMLAYAAVLFALSLVLAAVYGSTELYLQQCLSLLVTFLTRVCTTFDIFDFNGLRLVFVNAAWAIYENTIYSIHSAIYPLLSASYSWFLFSDNNAAFFARILVDILSLPNDEDAFVAFVSIGSWLLSAFAASDTVADTLKHFTGVASLEQQAGAEAHRYTALKSTTEWHVSEIAYTRETYGDKSSKYDETREQLNLLQRENELSSARLESVHGDHADVTATIARVSDEKQACEALCDTTATRLQKFVALIDELEETAARQHTALRAAISRRIHAMQKRRGAIKAKKRTATVLRDDVANARQALEATRAALDAQRAAFNAEHERLLAGQRASKVSQEQQLSDFARHTFTAADSLATTKVNVELINSIRADEIAVTEDRHAALAQKLDGRAPELANFKLENDEMQSEVSSLQNELATANVNLVQLEDTKTASISALTTLTAQAHSDCIAHQTALEERKATLVPAAAFASRLAADTTASLDFSTTEHRLHMSHCDTARASSAARLAALHARLSHARTTKDARAGTVAALHASHAQSQDEQREELAGLAFRLKSVSDGWAATRGALPHAQAELRDAQWALADARTRDRAALRAYRGLRDVGDSGAEDLAERLAAAEARAAELTAAAAARARVRDGRDRAALEAERAEEEGALVDAHEALSEREVRVSKLREELAEVREAATGLEGAREDDRLAFSRQLEKVAEQQGVLRSRLVEAGSVHDRKLAGLEERLAALGRGPMARRVELAEDGWTDESVDITAPENVQGSSRDGTPEREDWGQDTSYPATPALTRTSGTWSRSPSLSPALQSPLPYECSALVARTVGDDVEPGEWDGAEVKSADVR